MNGYVGPGFLRRRKPAPGRPWCSHCRVGSCDACCGVGCFHFADGRHVLSRHAQRPHGNTGGHGRWDEP